MMDLSDGLAKDVHALTPLKSKACVFGELLPLSPAARRLAARTGRSALEHGLTDGEDYELLFVLSKKIDPTVFAKRWERRFSTPLTPIGVFINERESLPSTACPLDRITGYEHLR